jgi:hypothetical protein
VPVRAVPAGLLMLLALTSCTESPSPDMTATPKASTAPASAHPQASRRGLSPHPFSLPCSGGEQRRLVGARHNIIGAVFAPRLVSPPSPGYANKILWSSWQQTGSADLLISASLNGFALRARRTVDAVTSGPSRPSIINMPETGCWTFSLRWGDTTDVVAVRYSRSP